MVMMKKILMAAMLAAGVFGGAAEAATYKNLTGGTLSVNGTNIAHGASHTVSDGIDITLDGSGRRQYSTSSAGNWEVKNDGSSWFAISRLQPAPQPPQRRR